MEDKIHIGGIGFHHVTLSELINKIELRVNNNNSASLITTVNTDILLLARRDVELRKIIDESWQTVADGMPIVWLSKILGISLPERVTGADLTRELCVEGPIRGFKLFFLGAAPGVAEKARLIMEKNNPNLKILGTYAPTNSEVIDSGLSMRIVDKINNSGANILLVALGAPKQEKWLSKHLEYLNVNVCVGVGASLDFLSGKSKRAPKWVQRIGFEWLFRVMMEPKRLWKRYAKDFLLLKIVYLEIKKKYGVSRKSI